MVEKDMEVVKEANRSAPEDTAGLQDLGAQKTMGSSTPFLRASLTASSIVSPRPTMADLSSFKASQQSRGPLASSSWSSMALFMVRVSVLAWTLVDTYLDTSGLMDGQDDFPLDNLCII